MKRKVLIIEENSTVPFDPRVWKEACTLRDHGYRVVVLTPRVPGLSVAGHEVVEGIHVYRHPMLRESDSHWDYFLEYGVALFWEILYTFWIFIRHGFQVIQGCNPPDNIFLAALPLKLLGVKYIFDHHDANPELYLAKYERRDWFYHVQVLLEKLSYRFSNVVMATNQSYMDLALTRGRRNQEDVFIVRNGPDPASFQPVPPNPAWKFGKPFMVGYVGNMSRQDSLEILLEVARELKRRGRFDVHFTCVGGGSEMPGLKAAAEQSGLRDMVTFTGRVPGPVMLEILSTADVCVNPDKPCEMNNISTMIKIMEYMALGKPIVQFDLREGRFSAGEASLYCDPANQINDFADKLLWLMDHPAERRERGEFGRRRIERELAWEYSVPHLLAAYDRAFAKHPSVLWRKL